MLPHPPGGERWANLDSLIKDISTPLGFGQGLIDIYMGILTLHFVTKVSMDPGEYS